MKKLNLLFFFPLLFFLSIPFLSQGQIWDKFSKIISPTTDTSSWELIEIEKINCSIKMPGQPVYELDSIFVNGQRVNFYSIEYDAGIIESLSFEIYSSHFPPNEIHSDSLSQKELYEFYDEQIEIIIFNDNELEIEKIQLDGYPAVATKVMMFGDLVKLKYAVVLVKNRLYTFRIYYDDYPEIQIPYFFNSFKILNKK